MIKTKRFFQIFLIFALLVFVLRYLTGLPFIRPHVEQSISRKLNINVKTGKITWAWLPTPHFTITNSTIHDKIFSVSIKGLGVFPNIPALFRGAIEVDKIEAHTPHIEINTLKKEAPAADGTAREPDKKKFSIPRLMVEVKNGRISLPTDGFLKNLKDEIPAPEVYDINVDIVAEPSKVLINSSFTTEFASSISTRVDAIPPTKKTEGEFSWDLNIKAEEIDLLKVRKVILLLMGENETVKEVCDIVMDGQATKAEFNFKGKTSDLENLDNITITANTDSGRVHIPETNIYLENVSGPLKIENSVLTGKALSAKLYNSYGRNGELLLGLGEDDYSFNLEFDIDTDLSDILPVMDNFIDRPEIKREAKKITHEEGSALIHLSLGNDLRDIQTKLSVSSISGSFYYQLLKRQIAILGGDLRLTPDTVTWNALKGMVGPNTIHGSAGSLNWKNEPFLDIETLNATLMSADFHDILTTFPLIEKKLSEIVSSTEGPVEITGLRLKGPVGSPQKAEYSFTAGSNKLTFLSPKISRPVTASFKDIEISHNSLVISQIHADITGQSVDFSGDLKHTLFQNFQGTLELKGKLLKSSEEWLKKTGWIPETVFPELPCRIEPIKITLEKELINISGHIIHPNLRGGSIITYGDLDIMDKKTIVKRFEIKADEQKAVALGAYMKSTAGIGVTADFNGKLSGDVLNQIFEKGANVPNGYVEGDCRFVSPLKPEGVVEFTGNAEVAGIIHQLANGGKINIGNASIEGTGSRAEFKVKRFEYKRPEGDNKVFAKKLEIDQLKGSISFNPYKKSLVKIFSGNLCGINISGDILLPDAKYSISLDTGPRQTISFKNLFTCLGVTKPKITGNIRLNAELIGKKKRLSAGRIVFSARNGVIKKTTLLTRILSIIDITELFSKNPIEHLRTRGYTYDSIEIEAEVYENRIHIKRAAIFGAGLNLFASGSIDIESWTMDLVILAAPFKVVDTIITNLPVIGELAGGNNQSVITVPLEAKGPVYDPKIRILTTGLKKASKEILDTFKKTFKIPFDFSIRLVKPFKKK